MLFSKTAVPFHISTVYEASNFFTFSELVILSLLVIVILVGEEWSLIMVFIYISLMINDAEGIFMSLLILYVSGAMSAQLTKFNYIFLYKKNRPHQVSPQACLINF